jgi:hypothetical protein
VNAWPAKPTPSTRTIPKIHSLTLDSVQESCRLRWPPVAFLLLSNAASQSSIRFQCLTFMSTPVPRQLSFANPAEQPSTEVIESPVNDDRAQSSTTLTLTRPARPNELNQGRDHQFTQNSQSGWWAFQTKPTAPPKRLSPRRLKWWLAICAAFTILAPVISIIMGWTLHAREMRYPGPGNITLFPGRTVR